MVERLVAVSAGYSLGLDRRLLGKGKKGRRRRR
jgi:hypothetical protein